MENLLKENEAAAILNVSPGTLSVWRSTKRHPLKYVKIGGAVRYRPEHIREFVARGEKEGKRVKP